MAELTAKKIVAPGDTGRRVTSADSGTSATADPKASAKSDLPPPSRGSWLAAAPGLGAIFLTALVAGGLYDYFKGKPDTRPFGSDLMDTPARTAVHRGSWEGLQAVVAAAKSDPKHLPDAILTLNRLSQDSGQVLAFAKSIGGNSVVLERCRKAAHLPFVGVGYPSLQADISESALQANPHAGDVVLARGMKAVLDCVLHQLKEASTIAGETAKTLPSMERLQAMGDMRKYNQCLSPLSELIR